MENIKVKPPKTNSFPIADELAKKIFEEEILRQLQDRLVFKLNHKKIVFNCQSSLKLDPKTTVAEVAAAIYVCRDAALLRQMLDKWFNKITTE